MKHIVIVPTQPGLDAMSWAWLISQSPNMWGPPLPPAQFIGMKEGPFGVYPDIEEDLFSSYLINNSVNENSHVEDFADHNMVLLGGILEDLQRFDTMERRAIWSEYDDLQEIFKNLKTELHKTPLPGIVVVCPTWLYTDECVQIAKDSTDADTSVKTLLVKSNLRADKKQRYMFLYNAYPDHSDHEITQEEVTIGILRFARSEMKADAKSWDARVNVEDLYSLDKVKETYTALGIAVPDEIVRLHERIKQHLESIIAPEEEKRVFPEGIQNFDWDTWVDSLDTGMLFEEGLPITALKIDP
jgi:hypothetical protein|tara:strand:+ start:56 stop:955 length:900 start_codon:yes stop_codon:yes gene_type:complete